MLKRKNNTGYWISHMMAWFMVVGCMIPMALADTVALFPQFGHVFGVNTVAISPDGRILASGSDDNTVKLWDCQSGELLRTLRGHSGYVRSMAFSGNGEVLATGSLDNTVKLWDSQSGALLRTLSGHSGFVGSVAFSGNGGVLASSGSNDKTVKLWDSQSGELLQTLSGHSGYVLSVAFSGNGVLASGSDDKTVKLWDSQSGELLRTLSGHSDWVRSVAFSGNGGVLASGSDDHTVKLWDSQSGELLQTLSGHSGWIWSVAFNGNGRVLASGSADKTVKLWDSQSGDLLRTLNGHAGIVRSVAFSGNGSVLASGSWDKTVKLWDSQSGELLRTLSGHAGVVLSVAFSGNEVLATGSWEKTVKLWDSQSGELLRTLNGHAGIVLSVAFSGNEVLASGSLDNTVKLWDSQSGELLKTLSGHAGPVLLVAFSGNGGVLASGSDDNTVKLWNSQSGELLRTLSGHAGSVWSVAFSSNEGVLASGSSDNTVKLWDSQNGELLRTLSGHSNWVSSVAFSGNGRVLASGSWDKTVKLWDSQSGELLRTLSGHAGSVRSVAFSDNGRVLASGSDDKTVKLWDSQSGKLLKTIDARDIGSVRSVDFSHQSALAIGGLGGVMIRQQDRVLRLHQLPGGEWLSWIPGKLRYRSSLQGDEYAAIRFNNDLLDIYPLTYYRDPLKSDDLNQPDPEITRKPLRRWWDKTGPPWWLIGLVLFILPSVGFVAWFSHHTNPLQVSQRFLQKTGLSRPTVLKKGLLLCRQADTPCYVLLYSGADNALLAVLKKRLDAEKTQVARLYVVFDDIESVDTSKIAQTLRDDLGIEVLPLHSAQLIQIPNDQAAEALRSLEDLYLIRIDPYFETKPITDPGWFCGRRDYLNRFPPMLTQGTHLGLFGLRKVGKTSLYQQLCQRMPNIPIVMIDCHGITEIAVAPYLNTILTELYAALQYKTPKNKALQHLTPPPANLKPEAFKAVFLRYFKAWQTAGHNTRILIVLDEIDKLFPEAQSARFNQVLPVYIELFRILRGLAQTHHCLTTLVIAYRPDVNRENRLPNDLGENPMFQSFKEEFLGFLDKTESVALIKDLGRWKDITWAAGCAESVYDWCGGHPLLLRFFASEACEQGLLKNIDQTQVDHTAKKVIRELRKNPMGKYFQTGIWDTLWTVEQTVLKQVQSDAGLREVDITLKWEDAVTNLENFGLIALRKTRFVVTSTLFEHWLARR